MENFRIDQLSPEQKAELMKEFKEQELVKEKQKEETKQTYKLLVHEAVESLFPGLEKLSSYIEVEKTKVFESFKEIIDLKRDVYKVKADQKSHTFSNKDNSKRITIGYRTLDRYDDTADAGIEKINQYLDSLATSEESKVIMKMVSSLLKRDDKGGLKANRVLELQNLSKEVNNEIFTEGVKIIASAFRPSASASFVTAEYRDEHNHWHVIPLSVSSV